GGGVALPADLLALGLATSPALAVTYAASGRAPAGAKLGRRIKGSLAHPAVAYATPVPDGADLDLPEPAPLDRYGGTGWGRAEHAGTTSRGGESRLVLPL